MHQSRALTSCCPVLKSPSAAEHGELVHFAGDTFFAIQFPFARFRAYLHQVLLDLNSDCTNRTTVSRAVECCNFRRRAVSEGCERWPFATLGQYPPIWAI
eukprot:3864571-Rhodomonas_salina.1